MMKKLLYVFRLCSILTWAILFTNVTHHYSVSLREIADVRGWGLLLLVSFALSPYVWVASVLETKWKRLGVALLVSALSALGIRTMVLALLPESVTVANSDVVTAGALFIGGATTLTAVALHPDQFTAENR